MKFQNGQEVVYHPGNWHYIYIGEFEMLDDETEMTSVVKCMEDSDICETCQSLEENEYHFEVVDTKDLMDYNEYCDHLEEGDCRICE